MVNFIHNFWRYLIHSKHVNQSSIYPLPSSSSTPQTKAMNMLYTPNSPIIKSSKPIPQLSWLDIAMTSCLFYTPSLLYFPSFNLICITKSWLSDAIYDSNILHSGYFMGGCSRSGGIMLALMESVFRQLLLSSWLRLSYLHVLSPCVLVVYTPPASNHSYIPSLLRYLLHLISVSNYAILGGDFNFPDILID